jgi:hypothetical protein
MKRALLALALLALPRAAAPAIVPDPGGAGAWAAGIAPLADAPGPLALFDQPARLDPGGARVALAAQRTRLFELDALTRVRAAVSVPRARWTFALGVETFGPLEARRSRVVLGAALARAGTMMGAAWSERRGPVPGGRAGALDAALAARLPGARGRLRAQLSARGLLAGGDPAAAADPDWTAEVALDLGPARAHLARTRDLHGARTGGGVALGTARLSLAIGAVGPPVSWTIGFGVGGAAGRGAAHAAFARVVHPVLGASDAVEGGVSW